MSVSEVKKVYRFSLIVMIYITFYPIKMCEPCILKQKAYLNRPDVTTSSTPFSSETEHFSFCIFRHFFNKEGEFNNLTAAAYHKPTHILVTGFASGIFHLHELPEFNLIHSLRWLL